MRMIDMIVVHCSATRSNRRYSLRMTVSGAGETRKAGVCNTGFWGMKFSTGSTYHLTLWVKGAESLNGKIYGHKIC